MSIWCDLMLPALDARWREIDRRPVGVRAGTTQRAASLTRSASRNVLESAPPSRATSTST